MFWNFWNCFWNFWNHSEKFEKQSSSPKIPKSSSQKMPKSQPNKCQKFPKKIQKKLLLSPSWLGCTTIICTGKSIQRLQSGLWLVARVNCGLYIPDHNRSSACRGPAICYRVHRYSVPCLNHCRKTWTRAFHGYNPPKYGATPPPPKMRNTKTRRIMSIAAAPLVPAANNVSALGRLAIVDSRGLGVERGGGLSRGLGGWLC